MPSYEAEKTTFEGLNAQVLGISVDHIDCLRSWADSLGGITYPLLSDFWPHGAVAECYGVFRQNDGRSERAIFVLDRDGIIQYIDIHAMDDQPNNEEIRKVLRKLEGVHTDFSTTASGVYVDEAEEAVQTPGGIVLYCTRWCKDCKKARAWLEERGLEYSEVDIDYDLSARGRVRQWGGGKMITPVIDLRGTIVLDYDVVKLEEALHLSGSS